MDELIIGNYDSIMLFGCEAQGALRDFSKMMSEILLKDNGDLEYTIHDIVTELEKFQYYTGNQQKSIFGFSKKEKSLIKVYNTVLAYIDKATLGLQLQEAQILKDNAVLQRMEELIFYVITELENMISYGQKILEKAKIEKNAGNNLNTEDLDDWIGRLDRRLSDLSITHTVLCQSKVQIQLMQKNNRDLIEKIIASLSGTIPIWRNQTSLLLGIEKRNRDLVVQQKVSQITQKYLEDSSKNIKKQVNRTKNKAQIDMESLSAANGRLKNAIDDLEFFEKTDSEIRKDFKQVLL